jgi:integrase
MNCGPRGCSPATLASTVPPKGTYYLLWPSTAVYTHCAKPLISWEICLLAPIGIYKPLRTCLRQDQDTTETIPIARRIRNSTFETRTARLKKEIRGKPYPAFKVEHEHHLDYRRNQGNGTWIHRQANGEGGYITKAIGWADDYSDADPARRIFNSYQARDEVQKRVRGPTNGGVSGSASIITLDGALKAYEKDLEASGASTYNAKHPRAHLSEAMLNKTVVSLTADDSTELRSWRDSLLGKIAGGTINRLLNNVCAALELASLKDKNINRAVWVEALKRLPDAERARNVILTDDQVRAFIAAAYGRDAGLGLFVETLAETGARSGQAARLRVEDLQNHGQPKLWMPRSGKGGGRKARIEKKNKRYSVAISPQLARKLRQAAQGRALDAPLLLRSDGGAWGDDPSTYYREPVQAIVESLGLDPSVITMYALRHSSIVRMLLARWPVQLVANLHDTSVREIESNYAKHITEHVGDEFARVLLEPEPETSAADNVIPLR